MAIRMEKPWTELTPETVKALPGQLGVYQLADAEGRVVYIGFAGGRSLFGLRSELERALRDRPGGAARFRIEVNQQYTTRLPGAADAARRRPRQPARRQRRRSAGAARAAEPVVKGSGSSQSRVVSEPALFRH